MDRHILVVEDEAETRDYVAKGLGESGYAVEMAMRGREGLELAMGRAFDAIVLDRMLPDGDGFLVLKSLRGAGVRTPVILLTAMAATDERVRGLGAGADDYLAKPFSFLELSARLEAILRRRVAAPANEAALVCGDLHLDLERRQARRGARDIALSRREFQLLEHLMRRKGAVVTRAMLLEQLWGCHFTPSTDVIDGHVGRLRRKIDTPGEPSLIQAIRGAGYRLGEAS